MTKRSVELRPTPDPCGFQVANGSASGSANFYMPIMPRAEPHFDLSSHHYPVPPRYSSFKDNPFGNFDPESHIDSGSAADFTNQHQRRPSISQNLPLPGMANASGPETLVPYVLDKRLQYDPGYRAPNQARDYLSDKPAEIAFSEVPWKTKSSEDFINETHKVHDPGNNLEDNRMLYFQVDSHPDRGYSIQASNNSQDASRSPILNITQARQLPLIPLRSGHSSRPPFLPNDVPPSLTRPLHRCGASKPAAISGRCIECIYARTACKPNPDPESAPGSPCERCTRLSEFKGQPKTPSEYASFIGVVVVFDMESTQKLLTALRDEAGQLTGLENELFSEDVFDGTMFCHMNYSAEPNSDTRPGIPVVIRHLAATRKAKAAPGGSISLPALDAYQLDTFIDLAFRQLDLDSLQLPEKNIIVAALRCSTCLGILFNWNENVIYYEEGHRGASVSQAKDLVLKTVFSIANRAEELWKLLCREVLKTFTESENLDHDPGTISCALWIVYSSLNAFKELKWNAKSLQNLKQFLNGLHQRAPAALKALMRYRQEVAYKQCRMSSTKTKIGVFKKLVYETKAPNSICFTYERQSNLITLPNYSRKLSYTDILEASIDDPIIMETPRRKDSLHNAPPPFSPVSLAELQKRDGTSTRGSEGRSIKSYQRSLTSESSSTTDTVPPLTMRTTIKDSETGVEAEIKAEIISLKSRLKLLKNRLKLKEVENSTPQGMPYGAPILSDAARPSVINQQPAQLKKKRSRASKTPKVSSVASGGSSHNSRQPKRPRQSATKPRVPSENREVSGFEDISDFQEALELGVPNWSQGEYTTMLLDQSFDFGFLDEGVVGMEGKTFSWED